jgi:hypothetical protein
VHFLSRSVGVEIQKVQQDPCFRCEFYGDGPYPDPSAGFTGPFGFGASFSASVEVIGHHGGCAQ